MNDIVNPYATPAASLGDSEATGPIIDGPLPDRVVIDAHLTRNDWQAYLKFWERREMTRPLPALGVAAAGLLWVATLAVIVAVARDPTSIGALSALFLLVAGLLHVIVARYRRRLAVQPTGDGVFLGKHRFEFSADGVRDRSIHCDSLIRWHVVSKIDRSDELLIIGLGHVGAFVIPLRYLDNSEAFMRTLKTYRANAAAAGD